LLGIRLRRPRGVLALALALGLVLAANAAGGLSTAPGSPIAVGADPFALDVGDLNGDGNADLVTADQGSADVSVLLGDGHGGFSPAIGSPVTTPGNPYSVVVGDLNGDGKLDVAASEYDVNNIVVLLGDGTGGFLPPATYATGDMPITLAIGDLNDDGILDLVTADYGGPTTVSVLLGAGDGTFGPRVAYAAGWAPWSVTIGDLNGDGKPDLVASNPLTNHVAVLLGAGDGTFGPSTDFATGSNPRFVAIADLNGDGNPDLATADSGGPEISVLLGDGHGAFAPWTDIFTGGYPMGVSAVDLNGDGNLDLVTATLSGAGVSVLAGDGHGGFAPTANFAAGTSEYGPALAAIADFDGDGKLDVATANGHANTVSILLNRYADAPGAPTVVTATAGQGDASVAFIAPGDDGGSPVTSYTVTAHPGSISATGATSPVTVPGLTNGVSYTFTVTAQNGDRSSPPSDPSNAVIPVAPPAARPPPAPGPASAPDTEAPTAPGGLSGRFVAGALVLTWTPASDNVGVDHYGLSLDASAPATIPGATGQATTRAFHRAGKSVYTVTAFDSAGNRSVVSNAVTVVPVKRPARAPKTIPRWAWKLAAWQRLHRDARPATPAALPAWYPTWIAWRSHPFRIAS
jgi:hypothetical protein